jgi:hypothetical protein
MSTVLMEGAGQVIEEATALAVQTTGARQRAADLWDAIRAFRKQAEAQKEEVCRPLKTAWDDAKKPFDAFVKECQGHESALQAKMAAWDREQDRLAREEQAKDLAEVTLKVAPIVQAPPKSIETQAGTTQSRSVRKVYKPKSTDQLMKDFPQLFVLDMPKFNALAKTGMLDGRADVEIAEEYVYSQR